MKKNYILLLLIAFFGNLSAQEVNIPDVNFKHKLLAANSSNQTARNLLGNWTVVDTNNNSIIEASEAANIMELDLDWVTCCYYIESLEGIHAFTNLDVLTVSGNHLTALDVSGMVNLRLLYCDQNSLTSLNVSGTGLEYLRCTSNQLTSLDVSNLTTLTFVECQLNQLTTLNLDGATALNALRCYENQLTSLDFSDCPLMNTLEGDSNLFTTLDFTPCPLIQTVECSNNQLTSINFPPSHTLNILEANNNLLTSLDLGGSTNLASVECQNNLLVTIDIMNQKNAGSAYFDNNPALEAILIKNGLVNNNGFTFNNCPNLRYICCDDSEVSFVNTKITQYWLTGLVNVNNYCTFTPGGTFYTIQGNTRMDLNTNGCDALDDVVPNIKFNISNSASGSMIADSNGNYSIPVQAGMHTITPVLENPAYFTVTPASATVVLPGDGAPFTQNFCIGFTNPKNDLEITVIPMLPSRPGFDAIYMVFYKNKGNTLQNSGSFSVTFQDELMDLVSTTPAAVQTGNVLSWNFTDLHPLESGLVLFKVNINSPMEIPAVNADDILTFTANITSPAAEFTPADNTFVYDEVVVNSFDPNDKTCLQGTTIAPDMVGKYVHYVIRFENTGTFPAENIVVKDLINTSKYDVTSLVPLTGSHPFVTRFTGNNVEFIFENINLPFEDANNDGYVAFKIKTKPTLFIGESFTNSAAIYFDYNFPIITNDATTTIQVLGNPDFVFSDYLSVYPNPAGSTLSIHNLQNIDLQSASIYNALGQLLLTVTGSNRLESIDVSTLPSGHYFLKVHSDKGNAVTKFIKK